MNMFFFHIKFRDFIFGAQLRWLCASFFGVSFIFHLFFNIYQNYIEKLVAKVRFVDIFYVYN